MSRGFWGGREGVAMNTPKAPPKCGGKGGVAEASRPNPRPLPPQRTNNVTYTVAVAVNGDRHDCPAPLAEADPTNER